jgi:hypothetical protein
MSVSFPFTRRTKRSRQLLIPFQTRTVDHSKVTENYRAAQAIALQLGNSGARTEDLRMAMVHCHSLFDELVQPGTAEMKVAGWSGTCDGAAMRADRGVSSLR